jgi:probable phosphomutase (TIGR03848 family)
MELLLIRHGSTDWLGKKLAGRLPGISLNADGRGEAEQLAEALSVTPLHAVYASPLERARETAEPFAQRHHLDVVFVDALQEVEFGELTGKTFEELKELDVWKELHVHPSQSRFPGGESLLAAQQRAVAWVDRLATEQQGQRVAAVSHADTIRLLIAHYLSMPLDAFHGLVIDPASVSILCFDKHKVRMLGINWPASAAAKAFADSKGVG